MRCCRPIRAPRAESPPSKIAQLAKKTNVNDERAVSEVTQERDSTLGKLSTTITLSGQYRDIRRFIYELEAAPEFLILETVSLSQGADASSGLNVTVRVATYYQAGGDGNLRNSVARQPAPTVAADRTRPRGRAVGGELDVADEFGHAPGAGV